MNNQPVPMTYNLDENFNNMIKEKNSDFKMPMMGGKILDFELLFQYCKKRGGYKRVCLTVKYIINLLYKY